MDRLKKKLLFCLILTFCCLVGICQDDQLRIVKTAKSENPKLYIASFDGSKDVFNNLQDAIYYSDWFEIVTTNSADFLLSASYREGSKARFISINLTDANQNSVTKFQKKTTLDTDVTSLIHDSVDEMIRRVFNRPGICSSKLAFVKKLNGAKEIWISEFNGANPKQFTHNNTISVEPSWSPGNRYFAYTLYEAHSMKVVLVDLTRGLQKRLTNFSGLNSGTQFSNDNQFAAVTLSKGKNVDLYVINHTTGHLTQLTHSTGAEASPCWSPDDQKICFVSDQTGGRPRLYLISASGGSYESLLRLPVECVSPDWSSVSNKICFALRKGRNYQIAYIDMNGEDRVPEILVNSPGDWESPSWAADGRHIVCSRTLNGKKSLYLLDSYYKKKIALKNYEGNDSLPDFSDNFR